ncbi:alpha/beta hydrolase [Guptibacillus spartinae]|uniref:alpha/beta hydrolase n=1 Tax=Guptibacillus spartinae TaxID=3025679 RepID=UPI0023603513|nr:alpha/beta hydrolase [Pseudalkalibacillus spartinae]
MKKRLKRTFLIILLLLVVVAIAFYFWAKSAYEPTKEALTYIEESNEKELTFGSPKAEKGIIFYQGGKVEEEAYAYLGNQLANEGYFVVIPRLTLNLAILDGDKAADVIERYGEVDNWYIGGHSLGGAVASSFATEHPDAIHGLFFLAAYPIEDMSNLAIPTLTIYGEDDGVAVLSDQKEKENLLSTQSDIHVIKGGNHANYGMYGEQKGDNPASITSKEQINETVKIVTKWIKEN